MECGKGYKETTHRIRKIHIRSPLLDQNLDDILVAFLCSEVKWRFSVLFFHNIIIVRSINKERGAFIVNHRQFSFWIDP